MIQCIISNHVKSVCKIYNIIPMMPINWNNIQVSTKATQQNCVQLIPSKVTIEIPRSNNVTGDLSFTNCSIHLDSSQVAQ